MDLRSTGKDPELSVLMIAPDRELARQFLLTLPEIRAFQILTDLKSYPSEQTLDIRLRQLQPDVVILDVGSNLQTAGNLIRFIAAFRPVIHVIGIHASNDSEAVLTTIRLGASEFLHAPFEVSVQQEAVARIRRLRQPEPATAQERGSVIAFTSAKPGSGASTLATQAAFAIKKITGKRVLLADFDLMGGTIAFCLKLSHNYSVADALAHAGQMDPALWSSLTVSHGGVEILAAPEMPVSSPIEPGPLHDLLEYARLLFDWVIVDLPAVFHRSSLMALSESDRAMLVSTSELPSLHLARKAVNLLDQLGFTKDRFQVIINRVNKRDGIAGSDLEKIFNCPVYASLPNDYFSLHRVVTLGQALGFDCELGKSIESLAGRLAGAVKNEKSAAGALVEARPALQQS